MTRASTRLRRWILAAGMALALTACGGGGGGSPAPDASAGDPPAVAADARNGTYTMVAANAREYALTVDFDAATFSVSGDGVDQTGTFSVSGDEYSFLPGNALEATGVNTTRFRYVNDTLAGTYATADDVQPFIAPRVFATTVADAVGTYDLVSRTVDATESRELGLATSVVPADGFDAAVSGLAEKLAAGPTLAYGAMKRALNNSATAELPEALAFEGRMMNLTGATEDHHQAVESFVAKERPVFHGK